VIVPEVCGQPRCVAIAPKTITTTINSVTRTSRSWIRRDRSRATTPPARRILPPSARKRSPAPAADGGADDDVGEDQIGEADPEMGHDDATLGPWRPGQNRFAEGRAGVWVA